MTTRSVSSTSTPATPASAARRSRILVLDDEPSMQRLLKVILEGEGYEVLTTDDGQHALELIEREPWDLVIHDLRMPKMDGLTFLRLLKQRHPSSLSIVVTAFGTWETAVEAMRLGAYTHLTKPFDTDDLRRLVARALERREICSRSSGIHESLPFLDLLGNSPAINAVSLMVKRIASTDSTVLITGESGTGKELVARAIHYNSLRERGPFLPVNCGAFSETLLESELFGHVKGAFTHAVSDRKGLFESADLGTLFLDEVGETSPLMQVKLLRVLETRTFKPVGGSRDLKVDVRIITATNRQLGQMVADGSFREDLFHRLNVIPIVLPPLRERMEDIPLLAGYFLARFSKRMNKNVLAIDEAALRRLLEYPWPGNVRELENTIERAVALCGGERITEADIVGPMSSPSASGRVNSAQLAAAVATGQLRSTASGTDLPLPARALSGEPASQYPGLQPLPTVGIDLERYLLEQERAYIVQALERTDWNLTEAAKLLGMTFRSIRYRVTKLGIERPPR